MRDHRFFRRQAANVLLHGIVGVRNPFVLTQVFRPRIEFERF